MGHPCQARWDTHRSLGPATLRDVGPDRGVAVIPVVEGPRTMLRSVALRGHRVLGERELLTEARLTWGEPFSYLGREDGSQTYPNRRYFLGGVDTLRGFNQDQLLPQDLADLTLQEIAEARAMGRDPNLSFNSVTRGGDLFVLARLEVRIPIVEGLQIGLFADVGNHWADPLRFDLATVRPTAGAGLRIATPVGPLALDYGFNLLRREDLAEPVGAFHFSIGVF